MRKKSLVFLLLGVFLAVVLSACGGGGGNASAPTPTPAPTPKPNPSPSPSPGPAVTASKGIGLANNADTITITTTFTGNVPADGTVVNFSVTPATAILGNTTATTTNGVATTTVKSATAGIVTITAASGAATANTTVKFIVQPTSMEVTIAVNPAISSLASLQFSLVNSSGATFTAHSESAVNEATGSLVAANQAAGSDTTVVALISGTGFNTGTAPIIKLSYGITSGLPGVQVSASGISATNSANEPVTLTPQNFVITIKYNTDTF